ncbi:GlmU family protein [soil metagenome]
MQIILDDISCKDQFYPFTATRSVVDMPVGIFTIKEKWENRYGQPVFLRSEVSHKTHNDDLMIPGNAIPDADEGKLLNDPWDIILDNANEIAADFEFVKATVTSQELSSSNRVINSSDIIIAKGAKVEHCILNAAAGPIYIDENAEIMEGSMLRGPVYIGKNTVVKMGSRIYGGTSIGSNCIVAGEIKNSLIIANSNKAHDGYLGDSIIGEWCNLGAGTSNSNLKNTAGVINVWNHQKKQYITKGTKHGLLMGDYTRCSINTSFNTGTITGVCCNIFDVSFPPKYIPDFSWGKEKYKREKAFQDIQNWKALKGSMLTDEEKEILSNIYNESLLY